MIDINDFFKELYGHFNNQNIDAAIAMMQPDVEWANAIEGGFVHGQEGVKDYWSRQFKMRHTQVTPIDIDDTHNRIQIKVHQRVYDLKANVISDTMVDHFFTLENEKIARFEVSTQLREVPPIKK